MIATQARQGEIPVTEVISKIDLPEIVKSAGNNGEISTNAFIQYITNLFGVTFEGARDLIYALIDGGLAILTDKYTLRPAE